MKYSATYSRCSYRMYLNVLVGTLNGPTQLAYCSPLCTARPHLKVIPYPTAAEGLALGI